MEDVDGAAALAHIAYETFMPGQPIKSTPGSEGWIGTLIRDQVRSGSGTTWMDPSSVIEDLRRSKCKSIVILTDYCGSGTQVVNYAEALYRNKTIKSWHSFGVIKIVVVAFAVSPEAINLIKKCPRIEEIYAVEEADCFSNAHWSRTELDLVTNLCEDYASDKKRDESLGFKGSSGLFITDHGIPNNVPVILRDNGKKWKTLFPNRIITIDFLQGGNPRTPPRSMQDAASELGHTRLARTFGDGRRRRTTDEVAVVLMVLSLKKWRIGQVAKFVGCSSQRVKEVIEFLTESQLLDEKRELTSKGWKELAAARRARRKVAANLSGSDAPYYPKSLR